jgi:uncharacterized protein
VTPKIALPDVNVLIALAWPNHVHHVLAIEWFKQQQPMGWATCPLTQSGFVRVSSNRLVLPHAKSPQQAILVLRKIVALSGHVFWKDDIAMASSTLIAPMKIQGHRQVGDAHLLAIALSQNGYLATLDAGIASLVPKESLREEVICLITRSEQ